MESDGVDEAFQGQTRVAVQAATQVGEQLARALREKQVENARLAEAAQREAEQRFRAAQEVARATVRDVHDPEWWNHASPQEIGDTYRVAHAWREHDPEVARSHKHMQRQLQERYEIDATAANADPRLMGHEVARQQGLASHEYLEAAQLNAQANAAERSDSEAELAARQAKEQHDAEYAQAKEWFGANDPSALRDHEMSHSFADTESASRRDEKSLIGKWKAATQSGNANREEAKLAYDSAERREATAEAMRNEGVSEAKVDVRMTADRSFAAPAREATQQKGKTPKASKVAKVSGRTQQQQLGR